MAQLHPKSPRFARPSTYLLTLGLATGSLLQWGLPVLADGTQAGETISNTATATYADPNDPTNPISTVSNTVVVTVAEIAGITVTASGSDFNSDGAGDADGSGGVSAGDEIYAFYSITNVGNDPTQFRIPNLATTVGPAAVSGNLSVSYDGGVTWQEITGTELITTSKAPGESVLVRVPVSIASGAPANTPINVTLGETPGNAQNQPRSADGGDVYTVDNADGSVPNEISNPPANGVREASATQEILVGASLRRYSLATVLKVRSGYDNNNTLTPTAALANPLNDDELIYSLGLRIEDSDPTGNNLTPAPLVGTALPNLQVGSIITNPAHQFVLVSDAIPAATDLVSVGIPPTGWTAVYSTSDIATIPDATQAVWTEVAPADLTQVTRFGFVYNTTVRGAIAPGEEITGFSFTLGIEDSNSQTSLSIANMAQAFGQSPSGSPVYDESGDQNPSNFGDSNGPQSPPPGTVDTNGDGIPDPGTPLTVDNGIVEDPSTTGTDSSNNNSGDDNNPSEGGEANVFTLTPPAGAGILNGPDGSPSAAGPDGTTATDFTNESSPVPPGTAPGSTSLDPAPIGFANTLENTGLSAGDVTLAPAIPPGGSVNLPAGTNITITYGPDSAVYSWNGTNFVLAPGSTALTIPNVQPGAAVNYGVEIDLPPGTPLSTDAAGAAPGNPGDPSLPPIGGFGVPILASIDIDGGGPDASNFTIDRVYTGYLRLLKESRILQGTGPAVASGDENFSATAKTPATGNIIEYRVTYQNITEPQAGVDNVILDASNIVIVEDGTSGGSNWARDNDLNAVIDTSNIVNSASDSQSGTIMFFPSGDQSGNTASDDVTKYTDSVPGILGPQQSGQFTFQRRIN